MIQIDGALKIIPEQIAADIGKLDINGHEQQAVVQTLITSNGIIQAIFLMDSLDGLIDLLVRTRERARKQDTAGIYIPKSEDEINVLARAQEEIKNENRNTK